MTEKEKLMAGDNFNTRDPELIASYTRARALVRRYNTEAVDQLDLRHPILEDLLGAAGSDNWIEAPFHCDHGKHIFLGDHIYISYDCVFQDNHTITIGSGTLIGPGCIFATARHPIDAQERIYTDPETGVHCFATSAAPIVIGQNCWLGARVTIGPGVTIGDGCVIGAGSVVIRDMPSNRVCYGSPCRPQRPASGAACAARR